MRHFKSSGMYMLKTKHLKWRTGLTVCLSQFLSRSFKPLYMRRKQYIFWLKLLKSKRSRFDPIGDYLVFHSCFHLGGRYDQVQKKYWIWLKLMGKDEWVKMNWMDPGQNFLGWLDLKSFPLRHGSSQHERYTPWDWAGPLCDSQSQG